MHLLNQPDILRLLQFNVTIHCIDSPEIILRFFIAGNSSWLYETLIDIFIFPYDKAAFHITSYLDAK